MTIVIVNQHIQDVIGGSEIQCDLIAANLTSLGHQVTYAVVNPQSEDYGHPGYQVAPLSGSFYRAYRQVLKDARPDIVYWRFNKKKLLWGAIITKIAGAKFVFAVSHIRDTRQFELITMSSSGNWMKDLAVFLIFCFKNLRNWFNYLGFYITDAVITNNADFLDRLPVKKQAVIHNSFDVSFEQPFSWPRPYVIWVSNVKSRKQPEKYLELAKKFEDRDIDFLLAGKIQDSSYDYLNNKDFLPKNFHYFGAMSIDNINAVMAGSLFLIHTCEPEGFPNVFIQSWLLGKPVVSLNFDPENLITTNELGYFSKSVEQFAKDTALLLDDSKLREIVGQKALKFAEDNFSASANIVKLVEFLKSL